MNAEQIAKGLPGKHVRNADGSFNACCPAHNDKSPSLTITDAENGKVLLHCHAGCDFKAITEALKRLDLWHQEGAVHTPESRPRAFKSSYPAPKFHIYRDIDGKPVYVVHRIATPNGKSFRQLCHMADGTLQPGMKGVTRVPYNLHRIKDADSVIIVEGEQSADALMAWGYPATTNPSGSGKWQDELTPYFKGKNITIIPDNDEPGHKHALDVAAKLHEIAKNITIANICDGLKEKADIVDWMVANPEAINSLPRVINTYRPWSPENNVISPPLITLKSVRLRDMQLVTNANWTVRDVIPADGMGAAFGKPGAGKTFWAMDLTLHIAAGKSWQGKTTKQGCAMYIPLESGVRFQNRAITWAKHNKIDFDTPFYYRPASINLLEKDSKAVDEIINEGLAIQEQTGLPMRIIVIDTLARAMQGGNENQPEDMGAFLANVDRLWKALGCFVLLVHHVGKDTTKGLRGHSSLISAVDTAIEIETIEDDVKQAIMRKQRDGEDGCTYGFKLNVVDICNDSDGEMMRTCIIDHIERKEMPAANKKPKRPPGGANQKTVLKALKNALVDMGTVGSPGWNYPSVTYVTVEQLKTVAYPMLACDVDHRNSTFQRALQGLVNNDHVGHLSGKIWLPN